MYFLGCEFSHKYAYPKIYPITFMNNSKGFLSNLNIFNPLYAWGLRNVARNYHEI